MHKGKKPRIYAETSSPTGAEFKIQETGMTWTLYVKEPNENKWEKIQSSVDAKFLHQVMMNQKEFRGNY